MISRAIILAILLILAGQAHAEALKPLHGASLHLGEVTGIAYYVPAAEGDRVVVTLARSDGREPVRFEAVLVDEQAVSMSVSRALGAGADSIEIRRSAGRISITSVVRTAAVE